MDKDTFKGFNDLKPDRSLIVKTRKKMENRYRMPNRVGRGNTIGKVSIVIAVGFMLMAGIFSSNQQQTPSIINSTEVASNIEPLPTVGDGQNLKQLLSEVESNGREYGYLGDKTQNAGLPAADSRSVTNSGEISEAFKQSLSSAPSGTTYSETNVQVAGVDEADIVKTDGNYLYQVSYNPKNSGNPQVVISKIYPASDLEVVSRLEFNPEEFSPLEMYVDSKTLVIVGTSYERIELPQTKENNNSVSNRILPEEAKGTTFTKALVYSLKDKTNPLMIREVKLEGHYVSSRKIGSAVYFVTNNFIDSYRILKEDQVPTKPAFFDSLNQESYQEVNFSEIYYFPGNVEPNYLMIAGIDLDSPNKEVEVSTYLGSGQNIYASTSYLFVAMPHNEFEQSASTEEPTVKDSAVYRIPVNTTTQIYKFALNQGKVLYQGKGEVPGQILNQFSMDEYQGVFRIATTKGEPWAATGNELTNNIYTLNQSMQISGSLEGLAPGEKIYSVRFMGDRAYMVTFKTVDPLFVIDLKDPTQPKALGELKIPGYSDYLQPYDETHLIGIGKETVEITTPSGPNGEKGTAAFYLGMKLALFDVSDVTNPKELFKETIGDRGTDSEALRNHKALLFDKEKNLLAFPVLVCETKGPQQKEGSINNPPPYGEITFQGAYVYNLNLEEGFSLKGKISHGGKEQGIQRILFVDDNLYTVSGGEIQVHDLNTLKGKGKLDIR